MKTFYFWTLGALLGHLLVSVKGDDEAETLESAELVQSLWMGAAILLAGLVLFEILRSWQFTRIVFQPNAYVPDKNLHGYQMPPKLPIGLFRWIPQIFRLDDEDMTKYTTIDDMVLLRFIQLCVRFFIFASILALVLILPINGSQDGLTEDDTGGDLDEFTVSNIPGESGFFWAHASFLWILSIVIMALLWGEYSYFIEIRKNWFQEGGTARCQHHAVLVTDIPAQRLVGRDDGEEQDAFVVRILLSLYNLVLDIVRIASLGLVDLRKVQSFVKTRYTTIVKKGQEWRAKRESEIKTKAETAREQRKIKRADCISSKQLEGLDEMLLRVDQAQRDAGKNWQFGDTADREEPTSPILNLSDRNSSASSLCEDGEFDVTNVPEHVQDDEIEDFLRVQSQRKLLKLKLREHFELCFPGDYNGCTLVVDTEQLDKAVKMLQSREDALHRLEATIWAKSKRGENIDKLKDKEVELIKQRAEAERLVEISKQDLGRQPPPFAAIVTFRSRRSATIAAQVVHSAENRWTVQGAPPPSDIFWNNLSFSRQTRILRQTRSTFMAVVMVLFFIPPITLIQNRLDPENLEDNDSLSFLVENGFLRRFVVGFLPQLITIIFLVLGHVASRWVSSLGGDITYSSRDRRALVIYFNVLLFNIFIIKLISGDLFKTVVKWLREPTNFENQPGGALSKQATFFAILILLRLCISLPVELIHFGWIIKYPLKVGWRKIFEEGTSISEMQNAIVPEAVPYHRVIPQQMLVFIIGLVYAPIAPLVVPFVAAYFIAAYFVWKYSTVYVYRQTYRSGGLLWPLIFRLIIGTFVVSHLITLSLLYVRRAYGPATSLLVLPAILILFAIRCESEFVEPTKYLPMDMACRPYSYKKDDDSVKPKPSGIGEGRARISKGNYFLDIDVHDVYHPPNLLSDFTSSFRRVSQIGKTVEETDSIKPGTQASVVPITRKSTQGKPSRDPKTRRVSFIDLEQGNVAEPIDHDTTDAFHDAVENLPPMTELDDDEDEMI